ncbi:histidine kinase [Levilactobacillus zymae]|uniref:histidine kinase n=1 Tax=Levilactobacillus zymae TaxID=267363 RepID=UPI000B3F9758|nr:histidine kinase [Levilactobacillus zymae]
MKVIQYNLTGEVIKRYSSDFNQFEDYPVGEKVRITTTSGQKYVGFWQTFFTPRFKIEVQHLLY